MSTVRERGRYSGHRPGAAITERARRLSFFSFAFLCNLTVFFNIVKGFLYGCERKSDLKIKGPTLTPIFKSLILLFRKTLFRLFVMDGRCARRAPSLFLSELILQAQGGVEDLLAKPYGLGGDFDELVRGDEFDRFL